MGWLLAAWLTGCAVALLLAALGAWWVTGDDYQGAHTGRDLYPGARHRATGLDEDTTVLRWTGERFEPAPPWTE